MDAVPDSRRLQKPDIATTLYDQFNAKLTALGIHLAKGEFGADMLVEIANDGPVTIILDQRDSFAQK